MLIIVSIGMKYFSTSDLAYGVAILVGLFIVLMLSPVENKNKPLGKIEQKVYKKRAVLITIIEIAISIFLKLIKLNSLFISTVYSFVVLSIMLVAEKIKAGIKNNHR